MRPLAALLAYAVLVAAAASSDGDDGLTLEEAGGGGGRAASSASDDSDERKTLSQQVADGKYGLIERELFGKGAPSAPGVLSYAPNSEVPKDNAENLGGLAREDIWLAEDHLLVLRGGHFRPDDGPPAPAPPIDDYHAPPRQVKIPSKPKVPPPFPVQFEDGGPLQILEATPDFAAGAPSSPSASSGGHKANSFAGRAEKPNSSRPGALSKRPENYASGAPRPAPPQLLDDDDPSIYYPPPYSFFYPKDNNSIVPPGPLVPGIVLPPPPDFFGLLNPPTTTVAPYTTQPPPPSTTFRIKPKPRPTVIITKPPKKKYYLPPPPAPPAAPSTPAPPVATQAPRPVYYEYFEQAKPAAPAAQPVQPIRTYVTSTAVPLRAFYKPPARPAQFFFYEEDDSINEVNTRAPPPPPPRYYIATVARAPQPAPNNFEKHIERLRQQLHIQTTRQPRQRQPRPVYQYSFGYDQPATVTPAPPRAPTYSVQIQPSVEYARPASSGRVNPYYERDQRVYEVFGQKVTSPLPPILRTDTLVNYRPPLPPHNPHSEYVQPPERPVSGGAGAAFISYRLPGDGAHFYFLTPQLAEQRRRDDRQQPIGYYYPQPETRL